MMVKPTVQELLKKAKNRYELVIATSKRARQIASGAEVKTKVKEESPVTLAANEIAEGEVEIIEPDEAKEEAARIIERAGKEAELEKQKVADEVKQQIVTVSAMIASKLISKSIDESESNAIIEQTLNEMGENTWRN